jgi:hypothetical protein
MQEGRQEWGAPVDRIPLLTQGASASAPRPEGSPHRQVGDFRKTPSLLAGTD